MSTDTGVKYEKAGAVSGNFLFLHFLLCSAGIIGFGGMVAQAIAPFLQPQVPLGINEFLRWCFFPSKTVELAYYVVGSVLLFLYGMLAFGTINREKALASYTNYFTASRSRKIYYFSFLLLVSVFCSVFYMFGEVLSIYVSKPGIASGTVFKLLNTVIHLSGLGLSLFSLLWVVALLAPWLYVLYDYFLHRETAALYRRFCWAALGLVVLQFFFAFYPFIFCRVKLLNEYLAVPTTTLLSDTSEAAEKRSFLARRPKAPEREVDTSAYINSHRLWGVMPKYDIRESSSPLLGLPNCEQIPYSHLLESYLWEARFSASPAFFYDRNTQLLCFIHTPDAETRRGLADLYSGTPYMQKILDAASATSLQESYIRRHYVTKEEGQFLLRNRLEMNWSVLNRWVIHHHGFELGPVNELALGRPLKDINMQYGYGNAMILKYLMEKAGGISYGHYFPVFFSWYYIYYALFLLLAFYMVRRVEYVLLLALTGFGGLNMIGYQFLFLGPGSNPIRHFLDLFVLFAVYRYFKSGQFLFLIAAVIFALCGVLNNKLFGLFLLFAVTGVVVVRALLRESECRGRELAVVIAGLAVGVGMCVTMQYGSDALFHYYLSGLLGFRSSYLPACGFLLVFGVCYVFMLRILRIKDGNKYVFLFLLFYSQELLCYYVWESVTDHFMIFMPIYSLAAIMLLKLAMERVAWLRLRSSALLVILTVAGAMFYAWGLLSYYPSKFEYDQVFRTHKTYEWNMPRAGFISTMNPAYFTASIDLIRKYARGSGIYMISKYDNFLPFLAGTYQAMPFPDIGWFLVTDKEFNICIAAVRGDKPEYLLVDSDIYRDMSRDILNPAIPVIGYLNAESVWRVKRLTLLQDIWREVSSSYEKVDSGGLIDVYRLKPESGPASYNIK